MSDESDKPPARPVGPIGWVSEELRSHPVRLIFTAIVLIYIAAVIWFSVPWVR